MEMNSSLRTRQKQELSLLKTFLIATTSVSILAITIFMIFFYNIGNIRFAFAAGSSYMTEQDGAWDDPNTWKGGEIPGIGDNVTIYNDVTVSGDLMISLNEMMIHNGKLLLKDKSQMTVNGAMISYGYYYDTSKIEVMDNATLTTTNNLYNYSIYNGVSIFSLQDNAKYYCSKEITNVNYSGTNLIFDSGDNSEIIFNGSAMQYLPGKNEGDIHLNNITIKNPIAITPLVELKDTTVIYGKLTLESGILRSTSSKLLQFGDGASIEGFDKDHYIDGPYCKTGTSDFTFYVRDGERVTKIGLNDISSNSTFKASYLKTNTPDNTNLSNDLTKIDDDEYWKIERTNGSGNARVTLYWLNHDSTSLVDTSSLYVAKFDEKENKWINQGRYASGGTLAPGQECHITSDIIKDFSSITFGFGQNKKPVSIAEIPVQQVSINEVSPNPFNQNFSMNIKAEKKSNVTLSIISANGQTVYEEPFLLNPGMNTIEYKNGYQLKEGAYILTLAGDGINATKKIIKKDF